MNFNRIRFALPPLLAAMALNAAAQELEPQVINIPLSRPGEAMTLEVGILSAHIEVIGEDRQDVQLEVSVADTKRRIITPSGTQSISGGAYALEVEEEDNHVDVDTDWRVDRVTLVARIPRRADLDLQTTNDGVIIVDNITGNLVLDNTNGPITARNISGTVIAESVNDTIDVRFNQVGTDGAMSFESVNGDIIVGLPDGAGASLHIDAAQGEITSDFEVDVRQTPPEVHREEGQNGIEVRVESVIVADVHGGGPVIRIKTLNGDIAIRRSGG